MKSIIEHYDISALPDPVPPNVVKNLRLACGMTQKEFVEYLGISDRSHLSRWEKGEVEITGTSRAAIFWMHIHLVAIGELHHEDINEEQT